jgi:hypothetical protein
MQTRTVTDSNNCGTNINKPAETQPCQGTTTPVTTPTSSAVTLKANNAGNATVYVGPAGYAIVNLTWNANVNSCTASATLLPAYGMWSTTWSGPKFLYGQEVVRITKLAGYLPSGTRGTIAFTLTCGGATSTAYVTAVIN